MHSENVNETVGMRIQNSCWELQNLPEHRLLILINETHRLIHLASKSNKWKWFCEYFSPPARWGLLDFMLVARLLLLHPSSFSFFLAASHLPALDRREPRLISSASSWYQWSSPDFNRRESERCGPRRTSTGESLSAVGLAGLQPARVWALDFAGLSTGESLSAVGLAGLQPARVGAL